MSKLCGIISPNADPETVRDQLRAMADTMRHDTHLYAEMVLFEYGGTIVLKNNYSVDQQTYQDPTSLNSLALCGQVVGRSGDHGHEFGPPSIASPSAQLSGLLHTIDTQGVDSLSELNGVFALAYHNALTHSLVLINDRYGFMPLYYYHDQHQLIFASEVKAVLKVIGPPQIDWASCADFFYVGHMLAQNTLFKNISALEPAQMLTWCEGKLTRSQYHDFTCATPMPDAEVSLDRVAELFRQAVARRLRSDRPNTLLLSGGFDSRLILGTQLDLGALPQTVTLEHATISEGMDGKLACQLAESLGLHCDYRPSRADFRSSSNALEVFYILDGMIPTWKLFIGEVYPELDGNMGMVWDGLGLDTALGATRQMDAPPEQQLRQYIGDHKVNRHLLRLILRPHTFRVLNTSFLHRLSAELAKIPATNNQFLLFLLKHRTRRRIAVNAYQLYAAKVEPVTPASDIDFMDYVLRIPARFRLHHRMYIELLRQHFPRLTSIPVFSGSTLFHFSNQEFKKTASIGPKRVQRIVQGLRKAGRRIVPHRVGEPTTLAHNNVATQLVIRIISIKHFDRPFYNRWLLRRLFAAYCKGDRLYHNLFMLVFYIELWHLLYIDQDSPLLFNPRNLEGSLN